VAQPIFKGTADTTTNAVMALGIDLGNGQGSACSGTVIAVKGNSGYYLTAAHCVVTQDAQGNPTKTLRKNSQMFVLAGTDYANPTAVYSVVDAKIHPSFNTQNFLYDFAMVRFTFNSAAPPVIPAMTAAEDKLVVGNQLDVIGYGQTDKDPNNSKRNHALMKISQLEASGALVVLGEEDNTSITCQGDSGGPGMFGSGAAKRVATVTSFGFKAQCTIDTAGVGRVSKVYDSFIKPYLDGSAGTLSCDECSNATTLLGGKCAAQADACQKEPDCGAFLDCAEKCGANDSACFSACQTKHQKGATVYFAIPDCICDTGCATECASEAFCQGANACGFTTNFQGFPQCDPCVQSKCCDVNKACFDDPACSACAISPNPDASCNKNAKLKAFTDCIYGSQCGTECGGNACGFTTNFQGFPQCDSCVQATCCDVNKACFDDPACSACATSPNPDASCNKNAKLKAFTDCIYGDTCGPKCGAAKCGFSGQNASCQTCFEGSCCTEFSDCAKDDVCTACMTGAKPPAECQGNALYSKAISCLGTECSAECGGSGGAGGSGTAGSGGTPAAGSGGSAAAGEAGSGGAPAAGAGGSGTAGSGTAGAGTSGQGGAPTTPVQTGSTSSDDSSGCGCQVPGGSGSSPGSALAALSALGLMISRRRRAA
jgi:MYXO-CTERM domain-containing protein